MWRAWAGCRSPGSDVRDSGPVRETILGDDLSVLVVVEPVDHRAVEAGQGPDGARDGRLDLGHAGRFADLLRGIKHRNKIGLIVAVRPLDLDDDLAGHLMQNHIDLAMHVGRQTNAVQIRGRRLVAALLDRLLEPLVLIGEKMLVTGASKS